MQPVPGKRLQLQGGEQIEIHPYVQAWCKGIEMHVSLVMSCGAHPKPNPQIIP